MRYCSRVIIIYFLFILMGCQASPRHYADQLAQAQHFSKEGITTHHFNLTCYHNEFQMKKPLTVYIEGDGHSWINQTTVSSDPTPHQPLALKLALLDKAPNVAYLARPCQYSDLSLEKHCHPDLWSFKRFSEPVIANMNEAIDLLKQKTQAQEIHLIGFSGGAAVAILIAARRTDVQSIKTVAGDLDHELMTEYHATTPLIDCLNPKNVTKQIAHIPQCHFIGAKDPVVPSFITENFIQAQLKHHPYTIIYKIFPEVSHHEGWEKLWPTLSLIHHAD